MTPMLELKQVRKSFTLHLQGGTHLPVLDNVSFALQSGSCAVLSGPSGTGKSSILKMIHGNYTVEAGQILVQHRNSTLDLATATPRQMLLVRRHTIGYVSQFLRTIPRVSALDVAAEPLVGQGTDATEARAQAAVLFQRLNLPERLWSLPPSTFSGGEQQRVNIARGFITSHPILLLDEPTASLDAANRDVVTDLIAEKKANGTAILGIFHDQAVRDLVADTYFDVRQFERIAESA